MKIAAVSISVLLLGWAAFCLFIFSIKCRHCKRYYLHFLSRSRWPALFCSVDCEFMGLLAEILKTGDITELGAKSALTAEYPQHCLDSEFITDKFGIHYYRPKKRVKL